MKTKSFLLSILLAASSVGAQSSNEVFSRSIDADIVHILSSRSFFATNYFPPVGVQPDPPNGPATNIIIGTNYIGTVQVGTNFYTTQELMDGYKSWTNIEVSYGDRFWRPVPISGIVTVDDKNLLPIKFRLAGNNVTEEQRKLDFDIMLLDFVLDGSFCKLHGHAWAPHVHTTLEYQPDRIACRQCALCGLHQTQYATEWK